MDGFSVFHDERHSQVATAAMIEHQRVASMRTLDVPFAHSALAGSPPKGFAHRRLSNKSALESKKEPIMFSNLLKSDSINQMQLP
jgi:hypothetical protein